MVLRGDRHGRTAKQAESLFVKALARGQGIEAARDAAGLTDLEAEALATSTGVMVAVAAGISGRIHSELTPRAIDLLAGLMEGRNVITSHDGSMVDQLVKPEVQLAAAQAILRIAKLEELPRPGSFGEADLSALTPEQLRAFIDQAKEAEARLAGMAQEVQDAPNAPSVARSGDTAPNGFSMLD